MRTDDYGGCDELHCCYLCSHVDIRTDSQQSGRLMVGGNGRRCKMVRLPNRKQIATAIVKTGKVPQSFDEILAVLKTKSLNECRWILHYYPDVRAAMVD